MLSTELDKRFENIEKQLEEMSKDKNELNKRINKLKAEKEKLKEEINNNKKKINELNSKIEKLLEDKKKYDNLKGRFIFKSFADYLFLIFDIKIDLEYTEKKKILKEKAEFAGIYYKDILLIIKRMKDLYYEQTNIAHANPTYEEITSLILDQYDEEDDYYMHEIIEKLKPQNDIKKIIIKNDELSKILLGNQSPEEKERKRKEINKQINELIPKDRKKELVNMLKKILEKYE